MPIHPEQCTCIYHFFFFALAPPEIETLPKKSGHPDYRCPFYHIFLAAAAIMLVALLYPYATSMRIPSAIRFGNMFKFIQTGL